MLLVDDYSKDETVAVARRLGLKVFQHERNYGYGRNQKTCYVEALRLNADIVVMLHPDYQYEPRLVLPIAAMIASGTYDVVLGSRILGGTARSGGMPLYKYISNRFLTFVENLMVGAKLSEYHSGYRAFSSKVLRTLPLQANSDDFTFDNEMLAQTIFFGFRIGEISCPTKYFPEASSISLKRSVTYGFGVLWTSIRFKLQKLGLKSFSIFHPSSYRLPLE
jgi:glycosyltransferase involved in cell wall biosynthesis